MVIFDKDASNAFRAIGRYVVAFSELVREMREAVALHAGGDGVGGTQTLTAEIALGEMQALPMSHAFFGLARDAAGFDEDETKVAALLSEQVEKAIRTRNDIAYGDWHVGDHDPRGSASRTAYSISAAAISASICARSLRNASSRR